MKNTKQNTDNANGVVESGWAGPGIEIWPEEDDYVMWRSMKTDPKRHLECSIPELAASPFCGKGYQNGQQTIYLSGKSITQKHIYGIYFKTSKRRRYSEHKHPIETNKASTDCLIGQGSFFIGIHCSTF